MLIDEFSKGQPQSGVWETSTEWLLLCESSGICTLNKQVITNLTASFLMLLLFFLFSLFVIFQETNC